MLLIPQSPYYSLGALHFIINFVLCFTVSYSSRQSVGLPGQGISPSQCRYLHRTTQTQNKCKQIFVPLVRFEHTAPVSEWVKTVYALDRATTVIGISVSLQEEIINKTKLASKEAYSQTRFLLNNSSEYR
jgi:hypothetical protein